jgi:deoxyribonuclease-4
MVHLNDSRSERGSRSDRHEHLGAGLIGAAGLGRLLTHPGLAHVAYLLETPGMDEGYDLVNMGRARDLVAGRPLPTLPPEAFETLSAKGRSAPPEPGDAASGRA